MSTNARYGVQGGRSWPMCAMAAAGAIACGGVRAQDAPPLRGAPSTAPDVSSIVTGVFESSWAEEDVEAAGSLMRVGASWFGVRVDAGMTRATGGSVLPEGAMRRIDAGLGPVQSLKETGELTSTRSWTRRSAWTPQAGAAGADGALGAHHGVLAPSEVGAGIVIDLNALRRLLDGPFSETRCGRVLDAFGLANARAVGLWLVDDAEDRSAIVATWEARSVAPGEVSRRVISDAEGGMGGASEVRAPVRWTSVRREVRRVLIESREGADRRAAEADVRRFEAQAGVAMDVLIRSVESELRIVRARDAAGRVRPLLIVPLRAGAPVDAARRALDRVLEQAPTATRDDGGEWRVDLARGAALHARLFTLEGSASPDGASARGGSFSTIVVGLSDGAMALAPEALARGPAEGEGKPRE